MLWLLKFARMKQMFRNICSFDYFCFHLIKVQRLLRKHDWCKERKILEESLLKESGDTCWLTDDDVMFQIAAKKSEPLFLSMFFKICFHPPHKHFCFKDDRISSFLETQRAIADLCLYLDSKKEAAFSFHLQNWHGYSLT